jgi:putative endonuclease
MKWYTYILLCNNSRYYIWSTNDLERRMKEHARWHSIYTRHLRPLKLVYSRNFESLQLARKFELHIKKQKDKNYINRLCTDLEPIPNALIV